ncbi:MAG: flavin monoamine oxidase family protein [Thermoleophilaceae bacterium]
MGLAVNLDRPITRRRLVGAAGAGALLAGVPAGALAKRRVRHADVVVAGAGYAGLTAARELVRRGHSVVVLEARERVGGRVVNKELGGGVFTERGGTFIGPTQTRIKALADEVGVGTFPMYDEGNDVWMADGHRFEWSDTGPTGTAPPDPRVIGDAAQVIYKLDQLSKQVPVHAPWTAAKADEWDRKTLRDFVLANSSGNPRFRKLVNVALRAQMGAEMREVSLLFTLLFIAQSGDAGHPGSFERNFNTRGGAQQDRFHGGSAQVGLRVAKQLGDRIVLGSPVRRLEQSSAGVRVESDRAIVHAKQVVIAMSPTMVRRIDFSPGLPEQRRGLNEAMRNGTLTKVSIVYDRPFWRDDGLSGTALSANGPVGVFFEDSPEDASKGIVIGFVGGDKNRKYRTLRRAERRARVVAELETIFGPRAAKVERIVESDWRGERWSRGCPIALGTPHALTRFGPALRRPVGRVHWAGTETADYWAGYMDGAVRSGERVAREIDALL